MFISFLSINDSLNFLCLLGSIKLLGMQKVELYVTWQVTAESQKLLNCFQFYPSSLWQIHNLDHSFCNGEEECLCTFVVSWLHGPKKGYLTSTGIEGMCIIKGVAQVSPKISFRLEIGEPKSWKIFLHVDFCLEVWDFCIWRIILWKWRQ